MVNLFIFEQSDVIDGDKLVIRDADKVSHLKKVLKVEVGSTIKMGMLGGMLYTGHIAVVSDASVDVRLEAVPGSEWHPLLGSAGVCLVLGTPRPSMTKSISTVSATMGVDQMVFVKSERVDKSYFQSKTMGGPEMKKNLIHGAEQGVLRRLPETCCFPHHSLEEFLRDAWPEIEGKLKAAHSSRHIVKLIAEPKVPSNILRATCEELANAVGDAVEPFFVLAIGPEGGWVRRRRRSTRFVLSFYSLPKKVPPEVELFQKYGFRTFHCGEHILRTETAVVALLAQAALVRDALHQGDQINSQLTGEKRIKRQE